MAVRKTPEGNKAPPGKCIFCGFAGKLTREHVMSRWTHKRYLPPRTMRKYRQLRATAQRQSTTFKIGKVAGDIRDWQVLCVCEKTCNNGWMRKHVEDMARPILKELIAGKPLMLTPEMQAKIASWAALKVMVAEYGIGEHVTTHHTQRKRMMRRQLPPDRGWGVWLGAYKRGAWPNYWTSTPFLLLPDARAAARPDKIATYYNSQASTLAIGELFVVVLRSPKEDLPRRFPFRPPDKGTLFRIWPPTTTNIRWPGKVMSDRDADYTAHAFKDFMEKS
ncbi:MAG: hypothetical protein KIT25_02880 [Enhydrobacter sp.]|nr:MAG: hypothetical protein KIT25_02880 [Enhydrobacter sp.]